MQHLADHMGLTADLSRELIGWLRIACGNLPPRNVLALTGGAHTIGKLAVGYGDGRPPQSPNGKMATGSWLTPDWTSSERIEAAIDPRILEVGHPRWPRVPPTEASIAI